MADNNTPTLLDQLVSYQNNIRTPSVIPVSSPKEIELQNASARQDEVLRAAAERNRLNQSILNAFDDNADAGAILSGGLVNSDRIRQAVTGVAGGFEAIGKATKSLEDMILDQTNLDPELLNYIPQLAVMRAVRDNVTLPALKTIKEEASASKGVFTQSDQERSMVTGDFFDPDTMSFGQDPSLSGYVGNIIEAIGYMAPQFLGGAVTGTAKGAMAFSGAIGAAQAGQGSIEEVERALNAATPEELYKTSTYYRDLVDDGISPEEAKAATIHRAKVASGLTAAAIGGGSSALMMGILGKGGETIIKSIPGLEGKALARGLGISSGTAMEEGFAEAFEGIAAGAAQNFAIGTNDNITENSFGDFVMGALVGKIIGTPAGIKEAASNIGVEQFNKIKARRDALASDIETGADLSGYYDINSPTFAPAALVNSVARAPKEQRNEVLSRFVDEATQYSDIVGMDMATLEDGATEANNADIAAFESMIEQLEASGDTSESVQNQIAGLTGVVNTVKAANELIATGENKKQLKLLRDKQNQITEAVKLAQSVLLADEVKDTSANVSAALDENTPQEEKSAYIVKASNAIIRNPGVASSKDITDILSVGRGVIPESQVQQLETIAETNRKIEQLSNLESVQQKILQGDDNWRGLEIYRQRFASALQRNDFTHAKKVGASVLRFQGAMENKRAAFNEAKRRYDSAVDSAPAHLKDSVRGVQVIPKGKGEWAILDKPMNFRKLRDKYKGFEINSRSDKLLEAVNLEADTLKSAIREMSITFKRRREFAEANGQTELKATPKTENKVEEQASTSPAEQAGEQDANTVVAEKSEQEQNGSTKAVEPESEASAEAEPEVNEVEPEVDITEPEANIVEPPGLNDPRILETEYRDMLYTVQRELVEGGGIGYVRDSNDVITSRTSSLNTPMVQSILADPDTKMTVRELRNAINKALAGKSLGVRQAAAITALMDNYQGEQEYAAEGREYWNSVLGEPESEPALVEEKAKGINALADADTYMTNADGSLQPVTSDNFKSTNLLKRYFRLKNKTTPLSAIPNLIYNLTPGWSEKWMPTKATAAQRALITNFLSVARTWVPLIQNMEKKYTPEERAYDYRDLGRYFLDENNVLDPNVATAIAYSAFNWVSDTAGSPRFSTKKDAARLAGRKAEELDDADYELLAPYQVTQRIAIQSLGSSIFAALGMKTTKDIPDNLRQRFMNEMGIRALVFLQNQGLVEKGVVNILPPKATKYSLKDITSVGAAKAALERAIELSDGDADTVAALDNMLKRLPNLMVKDRSLFDVMNLSIKDKSLREVVWKQIMRSYSRKGISAVKISRNDDGSLLPLTAKFRELYAGNSSALTKLMTGENDKTKPVWSTELEEGQDPAKLFNQKVTDTGMGVPSKATKAEKFKAAQPWSVRTDFGSFLTSFMPSNIIQMAGGYDPSRKKLRNLEMSKEATNDALRRDLENTLELLNHPDAATGKMYFQGSIWSIQRSGYAQTSNPQTNKIMRHAIGMDSWQSSIPMSESDPKNQLFRIALAQSMGVKIDNLGIDEIFTELDKKINSDVVQTALAAINDPNGMTPANQKVVVDAVKYLGEKVASLDALYTYNQYQQHKVTGNGDFVTRFAGEVDGKTNGPILTLIQMGESKGGLSGINFLDAGGFFSGNEKNYSDYRKGEAGIDLYEGVMTSSAKIIGKDVSPLVDTIFEFTGTPYDVEISEDNEMSIRISPKGRNIPKTPTTAFAFGSSPTKAVEGAAKDFVESILNTFEAHLNLEDPSAIKDQFNTTLKKVFSLVEGHIPEEVFKKLRLVNTLREAEAYVFSPVVLEGLKTSFMENVGNSMVTAFENEFSYYIQTRNKLNAAANTAVQLYKIAYEASKEAYINELIESGDMPYYVNKKSGEKKPYFDLNNDQKRVLNKRLGKMFPAMNSAMSLGESINNGLLLAGEESVVAPSGSPIHGSDVYFDESVSPINRVRIDGITSEIALPGVRAVPNSAHSLDSAVSMSVDIDGIPTLNIHDAKMAGMDQLISLVSSINNAVYQNMVNYSIPVEIINMASTVLDAFNKNYESISNTAPSIKIALQEYQSELADKGLSIDSVMREAFDAATSATNRKFNNLNQVATVAQYPFPGLNPSINSDMREFVNERYEQVGNLLRRISARLESSKIAPVDTSSEVRTIVSSPVSPTEETPEVALVAKLENAIDEAISITESAKENTEANAKLLSKLRIIRTEFSKTKNLRKAILKAYPNVADEQRRAKLHLRITNLLNRGQETAKGPKDKYGAEAVKTIAVVKANNPEVQITLDFGVNDSLENIVLGSEVNDPAQELKTIITEADKLPSELGELGTPAYPVNAHIAKAFRKNKTISIDSFHSAVLKGIDKRPNVGKMLHLVLELAYKNIPKNTTVRLIDTDTAESLPEELSEYKGVTGRTLLDSDGNVTLLLKSGNFVHHGMAPEIAVHEIVHASIIRQIQLVKNGVIKDRISVDAVNDLENVLAAAREKAAATNNQTPEVLAALHDIDELVAYGLTNPDVQKFLSTVAVPVSPKSDSITSAVKKIFEAIVKLVTKKQGSIGIETALGTVVTASATLMATEVPINAKYQNASKNHTSPDPVQGALNKSSLEVLDELANLPQGSAGAYTPALTSIMENLVNTIHGVLGVPSITQMYQKEAPIVAAMITGTGHTSKLAVNANFKMSLQEQYVAEQIYATVDAVLPGHAAIAKEVNNIINSVRDTVTPQDFNPNPWNTLTVAEQKEATEKYESLLGVGLTDGNIAANFMAMSLGSAEVANVLKNKTAPANIAPTTKSIEAWAKHIFNMIMDFIVGKSLDSNRDQNYHARLQALSIRLGSIESRNRTRLANAGTSFQSTVEGSIQNFGDFVSEGVNKLGESDLLQRRTGNIGRAVGQTLRIAATGSSAEMIDTVNDFVIKSREGREGLIGGILNEIAGTNDTNKIAHKFFKAIKQLEVGYLDIRTSVKDALSMSFTDNAKWMTKALRDAITWAVIKTDVSSLMTGFSMPEIFNLMSNDNDLELAIQNHEAELNRLTRGNQALYGNYLYRAKTLSYRMVTGKVVGLEMAMNAKNIADAWGVPGVNVDTELSQRVEPVLDRLITLYALKYTSAHHKTNIREVLRKDSRNEYKGMIGVLKMHANIKQESKANLFQNSDRLMIKGYISELTDQNNSLSMARGEGEKNSLLSQGWEVVGEVATDMSDPSRVVSYLMVIPDGGRVSRITGALSTVSKKPVGSKFDISPLQKSIRLDKFNKEALKGQTFDPRVEDRSGEVYAVPNYDQYGEAYEYRYLMQDSTRDTVLNRNMDFMEVMGYTKSRIASKTDTTKHNPEIVDFLHESWISESDKYPDAFIRIAPDSTDPELAELWKLLPESTRKYAKAKFGGNFIMVRSDLEKLFFGYRKKSITGPFSKHPDQLNQMESFYVDAVNVVLGSKYIFGNKAQLRLKQGEDLWQALVRTVKDIRVIRSVTALLGNITSNISLVWVRGMSIGDALEAHREGLIAASSWMQDSHELGKLRQAMAAGIIPDTGLHRARIQQLTQSLNSNPIKPLVDAGMFQVIVEDVEESSKQNQHLAKLYNWLDNQTQFIPEEGKEIINNALVTPSSGLYKVLHKTTQISDMVSRYALYKHLTTRKDNPYTREEALQEASDAFVYYDLPSNPWVQWANDNGLVMFTKYYARMVKFMTKVTNQNIARLGAIAMLDAYTDEIGLVTDSFIWNKASNLFNDGAFEIITALDEPAPLALGLSLVK